MGLPKCRLDVWHPEIQTVDAQGGLSTVETLSGWVKCDTAEDVSLNLKRANALEGVEISDGLYTPRKAHLRLTNKPRNFRAFDTDVYTQQYETSSGGNQGSALRLRAAWGPLSRFFKEFLHVRIVDLETHMVLFAGQIYKIKHKFEGQRGAYIELECRDALQALKDIKLKNLVKGINFPVDTRRSDVVQMFAALGYDYLTERADADPESRVLEPALNDLQANDLSSSALTLNSDDNNTGVVANNSYHRFEKSEKAMTVETKWKASKSGSDNLLQEMARWAVLEPHEDETEVDQFGYDFFADPDIGQEGLHHLAAPRPQMLNYYKRGNRLSSAGGANQHADVYGLTVKLPVLGSAVAHQGATLHNVGSLGGGISDSQTSIPVASAGSNYAGQVITLGSEQLLVKQILSPDEGGNEILTVIRGWDGSTPASHSNSATIREVRPAHAVMHQSFDFEDADDELYSEAVLEYVDTMVVGQKKFEKERTKRFEILYVTEISGEFTWSGKKFDDQFIASNDVGAGQGSAEEFVLRKPDGTVLTNDRANNAMGRIQYQSIASNTGSSNFGYVLVSDLDKAFPTSNDASDAYVEIKGLTSNDTCRVNLNATRAAEGRPATAWGGGNTSSDDGRFFRKVLSISRKNADEVDDLRSEVAARLARATNPLKRGSFQMSKAPYYWYDGVVRSETDVTAGQTITVKAQNGSTSVQLTNYGIREGMVVHKMNEDFTAIVQENGNDVYGYITALASDATFTVDLSELETFAVGDKIRIFIPLRAGDTVKVDNIIADIYGEHLITGLTFTEDPQPRTEFETIGENEPRIRLKFGAVSKPGQSVWNQMLSDKVVTLEKIARPPPVKAGLQTFTWDGTWTFTDYNTISWGTANVTLADGTTFQIAAGSTNDATYGLNGDMAGANAYVVYLDPEGENPEGNAYHIYTRIKSAYVRDADNLIFMMAVPTYADAGKPNCVKGPNFDTDFAFPHLSLNADGKATVSATGSQPANPTLGDVWIDTTTTNSFQRWNGSAWVEYDLGLAAAIGTAAQGTANTANSNANTAQSTANAKRTVFRQTGNPDTGSGAPVALAVGDLWFHTDGSGTTYGQKIFSASATGTGNWNVRDDAGAINNASTNIEGGRIETQTIILKSGGAGNPNNDNSILSKDAPGEGNVPEVADHQDNASRLTLSNTGIYGYNSSGNFEFKITTADGKGTFGGGNCFLGAAGLTMETEGTPINFMHDEGYLQMWGSETINEGDQLRRIFFNSKNSGDSYQTDPELNFLAPHSPGTLGLGHHALGPWGTIYANVHYLDIKGSAPSAATESGWGAMYIRGTAVYVKIDSTEHPVGGVALGDTPIWTGRHRWSFSSTSQSAIWSSASPGQFDYGMWLKDESAPSAPDSGYIRLYSESGVLKYKNSSNTIVSVGGVTESSSPTWTGNHTFNGNVDIGNSSSDTVTIDAKIAVGGSIAAPGVRWVESNGTAGLWYDDSDGTYSKIYFVIRGMNSTSYMPYFSSDGTYSWMYSTYIQGSYLRAYDGSASYPSHSFINDLDTGMYYDGGICFAYGGSKKLKIENTQITACDDLRPETDGTLWLGSSSVPWYRLYAEYATTVTSDENRKENMTPITKGLDFISSLTPITFNHKGSSNIDFGFTAQAMKQAVLDAGYTEDLGVYSEEIDEAGETRWGISYETLVAPLVASIKELKARIEVLEGN